MCLTKYLHIWMVDGKKSQGTNITPFYGYERGPGWPSTTLHMSDLEHKEFEEDERMAWFGPLFPIIGAQGVIWKRGRSRILGISNLGSGHSFAPDDKCNIGENVLSPSCSLLTYRTELVPPSSRECYEERWGHLSMAEMIVLGTVHALDHFILITIPWSRHYHYR